MPELDFKLDVRERDGGFELAVDSPAGGATATAQRPFDELALKVRLLSLENALLRSSGGRRVALTEDEQQVQDFGRELFDWLISGELRGRIRRESQRSKTGPERVAHQAPDRLPGDRVAALGVPV